MTIFEIILICASASIDIFISSLCKGIELKSCKIKTSFICGIWFSFFNLTLASLGYFIGFAFEFYVSQIDHWITFFIFLFVGIKTIIDSKSSKSISNQVNFKEMFPLAFVCSIDMFFVGLTYSFYHVNLLLSFLIILLFSFTSSIIGVILGQKFNNYKNKKILIFSGLILILIGTINLIKHLLNL